MSGRDGPGSERRQRPSPTERRALRTEETDPEIVLAAAVRFLETRPRSVAEVRRRLRTAGYPSPLIEGAVGRLLDLGYLDDASFARAWVESRDRARPRGERALRAELGQKGVGRDVADAILADRRSGDADPPSGGGSAEPEERSADEAAAARLLERRSRTLDRIPDVRVRRQRAYALLARNGFDPSVSARVAARHVDRELGDVATPVTRFDPPSDGP
ncbi:MAG: regulatory protein RecX [Chloroflexi bacterium]|nr:regulatory protein RecX [Chloroflexota bacterium]